MIKKYSHHLGFLIDDFPHKNYSFGKIIIKKNGSVIF